MKNASNPQKEYYTILSRGIYTKSVDSNPINPPIPKKWVYVIGRILTLTGALLFIVGSFFWATDGSWDIATIFFMVGLFFFIPFILFGREIKGLNKEKDLK